MSSPSFVACRVLQVAHHSEPWILEPRKPRSTSRTKFIERQVIQAWKRVTGVTRKPQRASILPKDFVLVTSQRRSMMYR